MGGQYDRRERPQHEQTLEARLGRPDSAQLRIAVLEAQLRAWSRKLDDQSRLIDERDRQIESLQEEVETLETTVDRTEARLTAVIDQYERMLQERDCHAENSRRKG